MTRIITVCLKHSVKQLAENVKALAIFNVIGLSALSVASVQAESIYEKPVEFPVVKPQVAYSKVTELEFRRHNEKIKYGTDPLQFGLLWKPAAPMNKPSQQTKATANNANDSTLTKPIIILIHGGCWLSAFDIAHTYPLATHLSQQGYPVYSLEYRRTGNKGGGWPGSFNDIQQGVRSLTKLSEFNLDVSRYILMGHSAGGHLALLAASDLNKQPLVESNLVATVGLAAITDIAQYAKGSNSCQTATPKFMGGSVEEKALAYQAANPINHDLPDNVHLLIGNADSIVPMDQSSLNKARTKIIKDAGHFDWIHPGSPAIKSLVTLLNTF
ncbi:alpha/beta hydrolase [Pleionea mediterranea]|uniref:Alpha/beta hydrolase family protein n=1 Tax=Pleionea mediterranea TaxID=523701 RepID=A0A316FZM9_9GAMM|nr:alpha/beta hydrolase [Pleionea mediterranea]PWK53863.1 alpha/beta hydrolase family protein [Pleionea mediterranea]